MAERSAAQRAQLGAALMLMISAALLLKILENFM
jgi:hypothetical protein